MRSVMPIATAVLAASFLLGTAPEHVQLLPAGEFAARDGRPGPGRKWKLSDADGQRLATEFTREAAAAPIVIDYDHQTLFVQQTGQKAPAAGWMSAASWRDGQGLWAKADWTPPAQEHLRNAEYGYLSPVIHYDRDSGVVLKVAMAALVNYPGLVGMEPVLTHLSTQFTQEQSHMNPILVALLSGLGLTETATLEQAQTALDALRARADKPQVQIPAALATELGIGADAGETAALAALTALKKPDSAGLAAMAALQGQVADLTKRLNTSQLEGVVDKAIADQKLLPAQRDWALGLGGKDMASLSAFIAAAPVIDLQGQSGGKGAGDGKPALDALAAQVASQFGLSAEQFAAGAKRAA